MRITFDPAKDRSNLSKHSVSLTLAAHLEWDTVIAGPDRRRDYGEPREIVHAFRATGKGWQTRMNQALREWLAAQRP